MASVTNMSTHKNVEKRYDDILKSQNDDRLYRGLILANKMKVLLISDSTTDKSAVAMDVNTGNHIIIIIATLCILDVSNNFYKNFFINSLYVCLLSIITKIYKTDK